MAKVMVSSKPVSKVGADDWAVGVVLVLTRATGNLGEGGPRPRKSISGD